MMMMIIGHLFFNYMRFVKNTIKMGMREQLLPLFRFNTHLIFLHILLRILIAHIKLLFLNRGRKWRRCYLVWENKTDCNLATIFYKKMQVIDCNMPTIFCKKYASHCHQILLFLLKLLEYKPRPNTPRPKRDPAHYLNIHQLS